jgi:hypothetical protein
VSHPLSVSPFLTFFLSFFICFSLSSFFFTHPQFYFIFLSPSRSACLFILTSFPSPLILLPSFPSSLHSTPRSPHTSRIKGPVLSGEERSETGIIRAGRGEQCGRTGGRICVFSSRVSPEVLLVAGIVSCLLLYFFFSFLFFFCLSVCFIVSFFVFSFFSFFLILP